MLAADGYATADDRAVPDGGSGTNRSVVDVEQRPENCWLAGWCLVSGVWNLLLGIWYLLR